MTLESDWKDVGFAANLIQPVCGKVLQSTLKRQPRNFRRSSSYSRDLQGERAANLTIFGSTLTEPLKRAFASPLFLSGSHSSRSRRDLQTCQLSHRPFTKGLQSIIFLTVSLPGVPDVNGYLQPQPELRRRLEDSSEAMRQVRSNRSTLVKKCVDSAV